MLRNRSSIGQPPLISIAPLAPWSHRIGWLHMPKSGTSFGTSLAHLTNASLPHDATIGTNEAFVPTTASRGSDEWFRTRQGKYFISRRTTSGSEASSGGIDLARLWFEEHATLSQGSGWSPDYAGRMFVMMREPHVRDDA